MKQRLGVVGSRAGRGAVEFMVSTDGKWVSGKKRTREPRYKYVLALLGDRVAKRREEPVANGWDQLGQSFVHERNLRRAP